jgi:hypothetical protein
VARKVGIARDVAAQVEEFGEAGCGVDYLAIIEELAPERADFAQQLEFFDDRAARPGSGDPGGEGEAGPVGGPLHHQIIV